jgi:hypothetical protein
VGECGDGGGIAEVGGHESRLAAEQFDLLDDWTPRPASRPCTSTCAPRAASANAAALPIPDVAPVTNATCPVRSPVVDAVLVVMSFTSGFSLDRVV